MTTKIEWTENTWNPATGCTKISPGCKNCYAERLSHRLKAMGQRKYENGFELTLHPNTLEEPKNWSKPKLVFVNSMSDLFHEKIPFEYIQKVFGVINNTPQHTYQILTKRASRLLELSSQLSWSENIWMGVSVENRNTINRIEVLKKIPSKIKFISIEPLLENLGEIDLVGVDWVVVGGESGYGSRKIEVDWVRQIRDQCIGQEVAFFFKQWGGVNKKKTGRVLDGKIWNQLPNNFKSAIA